MFDSFAWNLDDTFLTYCNYFFVLLITEWKFDKVFSFALYVKIYKGRPYHCSFFLWILNGLHKNQDKKFMQFWCSFYETFHIVQNKQHPLNICRMINIVHKILLQNEVDLTLTMSRVLNKYLNNFWCFIKRIF